MLKITVPDIDLFDPETNLFHSKKGATIALEHSLVSVSKWESKWKIPFLSSGAGPSTKRNLTPEQLLDYIRFMTLTQNVDPDIYQMLTKENFQEILKYIEDPMTATTINPRQGKRGQNRVVTSELIYYWMTALNIPFECQKWHLNRLLTLIQVASIEQEPPKKMDPKSVMRQNHSLNAARRAKHHTRG
jgi:hypothetical protein